MLEYISLSCVQHEQGVEKEGAGTDQTLQGLVESRKDFPVFYGQYGKPLGSSKQGSDPLSQVLRDIHWLCCWEQTKGESRAHSKMPVPWYTQWMMDTWTKVITRGGETLTGFELSFSVQPAGSAAKLHVASKRRERIKEAGIFFLNSQGARVPVDQDGKTLGKTSWRCEISFNVTFHMPVSYLHGDVE